MRAQRRGFIRYDIKIYNYPITVNRYSSHKYYEELNRYQSDRYLFNFLQDLHFFINIISAVTASSYNFHTKKGIQLPLTHPSFLFPLF